MGELSEIRCLSTNFFLTWAELQVKKKLLIVYYSWSNGNTERIAKMLQKEAGGD